MSITVEQSAALILRAGDPGWGLDVVTATELPQFPITEVHARLLWWPIHAAPGVLPAWRGLTQNGVPDGFTPSVRLLRFPALPISPNRCVADGSSWPTWSTSAPSRGAGAHCGRRPHAGGPAARSRCRAPARGRAGHALAADSCRAAPGQWRDVPRPAGQRRPGRDRGPVRAARGRQGTDTSSSRQRRRGRGGSDIGDAPMGRPGRWISTLPAPPAIRPSSGPPRRTPGCAGSTPELALAT